MIIQKIQYIYFKMYIIVSSYYVSWNVIYTRFSYSLSSNNCCTRERWISGVFQVRWGYIFRAVVVIMEPLADTLSFCILRHSTTFICIFLTKRTFLLLVLMAIRNTHWGDTTMEVSIYLPSEEGGEKDIYAVARILNISTPARAWVEVVNFPIFIYSFKEYIYGIFCVVIVRRMSNVSSPRCRLLYRYI